MKHIIYSILFVGIVTGACGQVTKNDHHVPLYLVNGKIYHSSPFNSLDANSIKSISVLKDKDAEKKYGEKGRYGAIIVYTKKNQRS